MKWDFVYMLMVFAALVMILLSALKACEYNTIDSCVNGDRWGNKNASGQSVADCAKAIRGEQ